MGLLGDDKEIATKENAAAAAIRELVAGLPDANVSNKALLDAIAHGIERIKG